VVRYKARLVAQGFTQRLDIDFNTKSSIFDNTKSSIFAVMNGITFQYLISLVIQNYLSLQLMDAVTAYLYGSCLGLQVEHLHTGILVHQSAYVQKILENFNMDKAYLAKLL
jgi:hypothetical protein